MKSIKMLNNIFVFIRSIAWLSLVALLFFFNGANGQTASNIDAIYSKTIKSVQFFREGWEFSMPIIDLGSEQRLLLKFDDLNPDAQNYNYSVTHCDAGWNTSRLVTSEYMQGFFDNPINDYAFSINTTMRYVNYQLVLPNDDVRLLISGNYLLTVWANSDKEHPVLTRRFYVCEPEVQIRGEVKKATFDSFRGPNQEIDFVIDHPNFPIRDPRNDIKVVLMQNSEPDNKITNLKPLFIRQGQLDYNYNRENVFAGGNEFRNFDTKNLQITGRGVSKIEYLGGDYHVTLQTDQPNPSTLYLSENDLNGNYLVKNDRVRDSDLESDYIFVKFSLKPSSPTDGADIYVYGALTDWQCNPANRMKFNPEKGQYEVTLLLKQGFYDYRYIYREKGSSQNNVAPFEGSFVETEIDYRIFVYFGEFSSRYERLIGYRTFNSVKR